MNRVLEHPARMLLFDALERQPPDALLAVIGLHRADPRPEKIDVGVGVYRDTGGATPVMRAVKAAERRLLAEQDSKGYLGAEGDQRFTDLLCPVVLGSTRASDPRITGVQTPGGTGALRLAAELIASTGRAPTIWVGAPTWPNHAAILTGAGLTVREHAYFDPKRRDIDFQAFVDTLMPARPGDVVLLHGCCHNPTGTAFSLEQWQALATFIAARGLVPLIDLAYQGLGKSLEDDAAGMQAMLAVVPEALVAYSCDKNFGLYRDRVGALWAQGATAAGATSMRETMLMLARGFWSMPPDHGAAVVRLILDDAALMSDWQAELADMRTRINALRTALGAAHPALQPIARQQGLFALLPIAPSAVAILREKHGIYMPSSGRINIAGLQDPIIVRFTVALAPFLADVRKPTS